MIIFVVGVIFGFVLGYLFSLYDNFNSIARMDDKQLIRFRDQLRKERQKKRKAMEVK